MPPLAIRAACPSDAALIFSLVRELADYEKLSHEVAAGEAGIAAALFGENPRVFCDIAEWDGEACGFALWFATYSTFRGAHGLYLEDLFVRPAMRGRGIGKALLARLAKRACEEGCARLEWAVLGWNAPSIAFYETLGAAPLDDWRLYRLSGEALERLART